MFKNVMPEAVGIDSKRVIKFITQLEERGLCMHSVLMAKGTDIFTECYWAPYNKDTLHRMYSTTKSYVGIAVAQLAADEKISLSDSITKYFPEYTEDCHEYWKQQTIEDMLKMQTCVYNTYWFYDNVEDRVAHYFSMKPNRPPNTSYYYDSEGSFVLGALVERVTGKPFLDYLREKCLQEIGFSKEAHCLKAPGGYSWADSALIATPRDMLAFGYLIARDGAWNGKQLLDKELVKKAKSKLCDNYSTHEVDVYNRNRLGYGYQIWQCYDGAFAFYGMHDQLMLHHPKTDITFVCTAGNPKVSTASHIIDAFFDIIVDNADEEFTVSQDAQAELKALEESRVLRFLPDDVKSDLERAISGKTWVCEENPMGITEFSLCFTDSGIEFNYKNKQGDKTLQVGRGKNIFEQFPQTDYSKEIGGQSCEGHTYRAATSGAWLSDNKFEILTQVIDDYIGLLNVSFHFNGDTAFVTMHREAENFLDEYEGSMTAYTK